MGVSSSGGASYQQIYGLRNKGIGGLVSGLDTDSLVESLISGTRSKIQKQGQARQLLLWKQSAYRGVATALKAFQNKYLKYTAAVSSNISSNAFFNTMKATSSSDKITVTANTNSTLGDFTIDKIQQLATQEKISSKKTELPISTTLTSRSALENFVFQDYTSDGDFEAQNSFKGKTLTLEANGNVRTIKLDDLDMNFVSSKPALNDYDLSSINASDIGKINVGINGIVRTLEITGVDSTTDAAGLQAALNNALNTAFGANADGVSFSVDSDGVKFNNSAYKLVAISQTDAADIGAGEADIFGSLGFDATHLSNYVDIYDNPDDIAAHTAKVADKFQELVDKAFGTKNIYNQDYDSSQPTVAYKDDPNGNWNVRQESIVTVALDAEGKLQFDSTSGRIEVTKDSDMLGLKAGDTNRVTTSTKLGDIGVFKDLKGENFTFEINGAEISVSKTDTISTLKSRIDASSANVRFDYDSFSDTFTLTSKTSGAGENIVMRDTQGDLLNTVFGVQGGGGVGSGFLKIDGWSDDDSMGYSANQILGGIAGMTKEKMTEVYNNVEKIEFSLTINGVTKTVKADFSALGDTSKNNGAITTGDFIKALNKGIQNSFSGTKVGFAIGSSNAADPNFLKVKLGSDDPNDAFSASASTDYADYDAMGLLGFTGPTGNSYLAMDYETEIESYGYFNVNAIHTAMNDPSKEVPLEGVFDVTIGGITRQLTLDPYNLEKAAKSLEDELNRALKEAFGETLAENVKFTAGADGKMRLTTTDSNMSLMVSRSEGFEQNDKVDIYSALGFEVGGQNNAKDTNTSLTLGKLAGGTGLSGTLTINGDTTRTISYDENTQLQDLINGINDKYGVGSAYLKNGQLVISDNSGQIKIEDDGNLLNNIFGLAKDDPTDPASKTTYTTAAADPSKMNRKEGTNLEVLVDGRSDPLTFSSNTFEMYGVSIEVNDLSDTAIKVNVKSDPGDVVDRLKTWVEDYNALVISMSTIVNEDKSEGDYPPLTDEQKAQMSEDQIKTWETEAKKGLLRNDSTFREILSQLHEVLYSTVESAGIALYDIGITTKGYEDIGQLEITAAGEERLRKILTEDPDKVRTLFTATDGIAARLNTVIDDAANESSIDRGSLYVIAGTTGLTGDNSSTIGSKLEFIDDYIYKLKERLNNEYERYWKKFSSLETAIQKMNTQSGWLQQYGG